MASKRKKPCEDGRACRNQWADLCLAYQFPVWDVEKNIPSIGYRQRSDVSYEECMEEKHVCPRTGKTIKGVFAPILEGGEHEPRHHNRYWTAKQTVRQNRETTTETPSGQIPLGGE